MPAQLPRCRLVPLPDHQVAFVINGQEWTRWHFGQQYPRPFFYPLPGPSGESVTRMGHPGAPNHDHHRSVWFAHHKVLGIDFWGDNTDARIVQQQWISYEDGETEAAMAVQLGWYDGHEPRELLVQQLIAAVRPANPTVTGDAEMLLEVQSTFTPTSELLEFGQTNFGFFAVRVARHISAYFGGGTLTSSQRSTGEPANFAKPARWMDYSGPAADGDGFEGITYFDHPGNPGQPTHWHVREDGWMGASPGMNGSLVTQQAAPLSLRYLLHVHRGGCDPDETDLRADRFAASPVFELVKPERKHTERRIQRADA